MKVTISSSSNDKIDDAYKKTSRKVISFLAQNNYDLIWGSGNASIMGICYEEFSKYNRKIYGYTTKKYADLLEHLTNGNYAVEKDTFDLKKKLFKEADIILFLPGGTGTISEFFACLEETRSNDKQKVIIVYNENKWFDMPLKLISDLVNKNFNQESIYNYFKVADNIDELKRILNENKEDNYE